MGANLAHWEGTAAEHGTDHWASWGDAHAIELEIQNLLAHLEPGMRLLDAGCANGYTTFRILERRPNEVRAFDYSPRMVEAAQAARPARDPEGKVTFYQGNILEIAEPDASFDACYAVRVVINLPTWERQQQAIREMHRVLLPGGRYILSEAFEGSQRLLNQLRALAGLAPLSAPSFNLYLEEELLETFVADLFEIEEVSRFSSLYYVGTRFVRDLTLQDGEEPSYRTPLHDFFAHLPTTAKSGDFGIQKAYILKKR